MKVVQILQKPQWRGAEVFACQLSNHLMEMGYDINVIFIQKGTARLPFDGKVSYLSRPVFLRLFDIWGYYRLAVEIDALKPDVVQSNAGDTLKYAVLSKVIFRWSAPIVFRNASLMSRYLRSPWKYLLNRMLFHGVQRVASVSEASKKDFLELFPFMSGRVLVVPVGIDIHAMSAGNLNRSDYIIHVGGFTFEKNHKQVIRIFLHLKKLHPHLRLLLVGDGPLKEEIADQIRSSRITGVELLGNRSDVISLIRSARLLLLASLIEGLPAVILEAMYCRTPVIAFSVGGIPEVVRPGDTGWLIEPGAEEDFVRGAMQILDGEDVKRITSNAHSMVMLKFDNKQIAKNFADIYQSVVNTKDALCD
ncbi:MAG: glycosyltransferase family 4 protein [Cyclobacteriaceae bacterium]